jgi:chromate transporter
VPGAASRGNAPVRGLESTFFSRFPMTPTLSGAANARLQAISRSQLFASFLKMGLLGFGGVLPWARRVIVDERRWLTDREFAELIGLCQVLPGPNVVNLAVIVGTRSRGPVGALLAVGALLFVPVGVMLLIAMFYAQVANVPYVRDGIAAASAAAAGLILGTATRLLVQARPPLRGMVTGGAAFIAVGILHWPLFWVIVALIAVGVTAEWRASR